MAEEKRSAFQAQRGEESTGEEHSVWGRTTSTLALISLEKAGKGVRLEVEAGSGPGPVWALFCRCWEAMYSPADTYRAPARCLGLLRLLRTPHCTIQARTLRVLGEDTTARQVKQMIQGKKAKMATENSEKSNLK